MLGEVRRKRLLGGSDIKVGDVTILEETSQAEGAAGIKSVGLEGVRGSQRPGLVGVASWETPPWMLEFAFYCYGKDHDRKQLGREKGLFTG